MVSYTSFTFTLHFPCHLYLIAVFLYLFSVSKTCITSYWSECTRVCQREGASKSSRMRTKIVFFCVTHHREKVFSPRAVNTPSFQHKISAFEDLWRPEASHGKSANAGVCSKWRLAQAPGSREMPRIKSLCSLSTASPTAFDRK